MKFLLPMLQLHQSLILSGIMVPLTRQTRGSLLVSNPVCLHQVADWIPQGSFLFMCLTCGEGPMGKRWWVGRISSLPVFLSLWFWLWLDWWSATFQGTSYQAQRDLERMMMPFFTEQPAICQLPVMAQRPVSETSAQGCTWTVMGRLKLAYERWTENLASPFWRRRVPAARWC